MDDLTLFNTPPKEEITRAEIIEEKFPCPSGHIPTFFGKYHKKYYRFQFFYDKDTPEWSSGRFREMDRAETEMYKFLNGEACNIFGDVARRGNKYV